jgi:hypothetical protein
MCGGRHNLTITNYLPKVTMDYAEEQKGEIEALESIYYGDLTSKCATLLELALNMFFSI